jgi:hypothetical protein
MRERTYQLHGSATSGVTGDLRRDRSARSPSTRHWCDTSRGPRSTPRSTAAIAAWHSLAVCLALATRRDESQSSHGARCGGTDLRHDGAARRSSTSHDGTRQRCLSTRQRCLDTTASLRHYRPCSAPSARARSSGDYSVQQLRPTACHSDDADDRSEPADRLARDRGGDRSRVGLTQPDRHLRDPGVWSLRHTSASIAIACSDLAAAGGRPARSSGAAQYRDVTC